MMTDFHRLGRAMASEAGMTTLILRNMLLGKWAAAKMRLGAEQAEAYAQNLASSAPDPLHADAFGMIRRDLEAAGVHVPDAEILEAITDCAIKAGNQLSTRQGEFSDAAGLLLKRNLSSR